ncbi:MAG: PhoH family protein [Humidesulfovibrio sp.]|uniref:PhoH family protein n=1 Tax=Humidesulfovibrio sp. TaxID=2910988 RepID=UPI00273771D8|nr:PhoH family protein [Humidesulfovibrio sp.]MDP2848132.1 PhoH family protein [Humidesulfovibrio sp.]
MSMKGGSTRKLEFQDSGLANKLFGPQGANLALLTEKSGVVIETRGAACTLTGEPDLVEVCASVLTQLYGLFREGRQVHPQDVDCAWRILLREPGSDIRRIFQDTVYVASPKKTIAPKTISQRDYLEAIRQNDLVFGIGPAGTGKTYLAVALAVSSLMRREVKRIVLARPAVEAGEKLGFLPGDLAEKVNPYLRPLYDALHDMLDFARVQDMLETGVIEVAPLAFMRGRTLNDAFVILDEAQNTTPEQMKMFLTRLGFGSRCVVTGDVTQIDLPSHTRSGLVEAHRILQGVQGIRFVAFHEEDVIRHPLVGRIVHAYERSQREAKGETKPGAVSEAQPEDKPAPKAAAKSGAKK